MSIEDGCINCIYNKNDRCTAVPIPVLNVLSKSLLSNVSDSTYINYFDKESYKCILYKKSKSTKTLNG